MTDPLERLEVELAGMRPRPMPADLTARIARTLEPGRAVQVDRRWPDRCLIGALSSGALAACVIAGVLLNESSRPIAVPSPMTDVAFNPAIPQVGNSPQLFAHADAGWADLLK